MAIELKGYNLIGTLDDEQDALKSFVNEYDGSTYICDAITEIGDSFIPIYNYDVWNDASAISEHIEEAIASGLAPTEAGNIDLIKIFQAGYYQYYTQSLYDNLDAMAFNKVATKVNEYLNTLTEEQVSRISLSELEESIETETENTDNNDMLNIFDDKAEEIISRIKEEEFVA
jgi:hypothetical protein